MKAIDLKVEITEESFNYLDKYFEFFKRPDGSWFLSDAETKFKFPYVFFFPDGTASIIHHLNKQSTLLEFKTAQDAVDFMMVK